MLTSTNSWLLALADPEWVKLRLPHRPLGRRRLNKLIELSDRHGVLPAVAANLSRACEEFGPDRLVRSPGISAQAGRRVLEAALAAAGEKLAKRTALSLMLRRRTDETTEALTRHGVRVVVLKGSEFADRLYPSPELRPFTDVDLLVPRRDLGEVDQVMRELSYTPQEVRMKYEDDYGETAWRRPGGHGGKIEIHWNLVNSPSLRRGISVELEDLQFDSAQTDAAGLLKPSTSALLLIAAVHAAASHCFEKLRLLCDVRQAVRAAGGSLDERWLIGAAGRTGSNLALAAALYLSDKILSSPACGELLRRLKLSGTGCLWKLLLARGVVIRAGASIDSFRRQIFRELLKRQ